MELNDYAIRLFQVMEELESLKFFGECEKLSRTEGRLLKEVISEYAKGRDIISSELARRLGVTRSAVSQLVTKLEEQDIVARTAAPDDRKIAYIRLSEHALAQFEEKCKQLNELLETCANKFGKDRMQRLSVDTADFIALIKAARETEAGEVQE